MTRPMLMISVALASYAVISSLGLARRDAGVADGLVESRPVIRRRYAPGAW